jgi:hypothetical protein
MLVICEECSCQFTEQTVPYNGTNAPNLPLFDIILILHIPNDLLISLKFDVYGSVHLGNICFYSIPTGCTTVKPVLSGTSRDQKIFPLKPVSV